MAWKKGSRQSSGCIDGVQDMVEGASDNGVQAAVASLLAEMDARICKWHENTKIELIHYLDMTPEEYHQYLHNPEGWAQEVVRKRLGVPAIESCARCGDCACPVAEDGTRDEESGYWGKCPLHGRGVVHQACAYINELIAERDDARAFVCWAADLGWLKPGTERAAATVAEYRKALSEVEERERVDRDPEMPWLQSGGVDPGGRT